LNSCGVPTLLDNPGKAGKLRSIWMVREFHSWLRMEKFVRYGIIKAMAYFAPSRIKQQPCFGCEQNDGTCGLYTRIAVTADKDAYV